MKLLWIWLIIVNPAAYILMGEDKRRAIGRKRRIPERTLLLLAAAGGSLGELLGMLAFRHKTRHLKFMLGVPAIALVQVVIVCRVLMR